VGAVGAVGGDIRNGPRVAVMARPPTAHNRRQPPAAHLRQRAHGSDSGGGIRGNGCGNGNVRCGARGATGAQASAAHDVASCEVG
ncbi:hypothetical protein, partial [Streptomyces sp. KL116D]|uniref:hypothetical protein n=1 Tax=Streptomyces sp. KL116D TaxID=3045152 RepID=UPI0035591AED